MLSKIAVVGDHDTCLGFSLAGVAQTHEVSAETADAKIAQLLESKELGILIVTTEALESLSHKVKKHVQESVKPVVIEVPSKNSRGEAGGESINAMVKKAIGIDLK